MLSLVALQKTKHQPPPSCFCSLSRELPLPKVLAAACISAQDAQMGWGVPDHCSHVGTEGKQVPHSRTKGGHFHISLHKHTLDRYPIFAYSRASLLLVKRDFFQDNWQETCMVPWLHKIRQIPEAKPYHYLHQNSPSLCNSLAQAAPQAGCLGEGFGNHMPCSSQLCSAVIFKTSSEGNYAKGCVSSMGHGSMSGYDHTATNPSLPTNWLSSWCHLPVGGYISPSLCGKSLPCLLRAGTAVSHTVLRLGHSTAPSSSWMDGNSSWSIRSGRCPSALCPWHMCSSGFALPRPPEPPQTQWRQVQPWLLRNIRPWCMTTTKYTPHTHRHTKHTSWVCMTWLQLVLHEHHFCYMLQSIWQLP